MPFRYLLFTPEVRYISQQRPTNIIPSGNSKNGKNAPGALPIVVLQLEDKDLLNFITGGLTGIKGYTEGKIKIVGDFEAARTLERMFVKAGGVEKSLSVVKAKL
jgi:hypothetical protein